MEFNLMKKDKITYLSILVLMALSAEVKAKNVDNINDMVAKGTVDIESRTFNFNRYYSDSKTDLSDIATGGMLYYKTAKFNGLSFGTTLYTANDLGSSDNKGVYGVLAKDEINKHDSFTRLGEYYIDYKFFNTEVKYGAQEINTPWVNKWDFRITPKSYQGLTLANKSIENLELYAAYIYGYANNTDDEYSDISAPFSKNMDGKDLYFFGAKYNYKFSKQFSSTPQLWYYNLNDGYTIKYIENSFKYSTDNYKFSFTPSYVKQESEGKELGGNFETYQYGFRSNATVGSWDINIYYAKTGNNSIIMPWGNRKIIVQQINACTRAHEEAYGARVFYNFSHMGIKGLIFGVSYINYDTPETGDYASYDVAETNYDLVYTFDKSIIDGLKIRFRFADVQQDESLGGADFTDFRIQVYYKFSLK